MQGIPRVSKKSHIWAKKTVDPCPDVYGKDSSDILFLQKNLLASKGKKFMFGCPFSPGNRTCPSNSDLNFSKHEALEDAYAFILSGAIFMSKTY